MQKNIGIKDSGIELLKGGEASRQFRLCAIAKIEL